MMSAIRVTIFLVAPILTHLHRSILLVDSLFQFNSPLISRRWFVGCDGWCIYWFCVVSIVESIGLCDIFYLNNG